MMSASKYFQALLGPNFKEGQEEEVTIDIDGRTLKSIIDFCYTGKLNITEENITRIIAAASSMELVVIEEKCQQFWHDNLATSNCVEIFSLADQYSFVRLRNKSFKMICEYFENVSIDELQALPFQCFAELVKCDQIHSVWQEEFIFQRMALWVDFNEENRSQYAPELFQWIRLSILSKEVRGVAANSEFNFCTNVLNICDFFVFVQFLLDFVETFARKYNCVSLLLTEYHRRIKNDGKPMEPFHLTRAASKRIFVISGRDGGFTIEKYNPISDRWELVHRFSDKGFRNRERFGQIVAENKLFLIGGKKGKTYMRTVS